MDDQVLAGQLAKTGNIMDLARDEAWVRESARIEDECGGRVEAGLAMKAYAQAKYDDSLAHVRAQLKQQMQVQSVLFVALRRWMAEWEIGAALEETYTAARRLVRAHLEEPSPELAAWVEALLVEGTQVDDGAEQPVQAGARMQLAGMMTDEDWQVLAQVAAAAAADIAAESIRKVSQGEPQETAAA